MSKIKTQKLIVIGILLIICCVLIYVYTASPPPSNSSFTKDPIGKAYGVETQVSDEMISPISVKKDSVVNKIEPEKETASLKNTENITIILGEETINLSVPPNTLFYDALVQAKNQEQITFDGKNYPGLGFFITDIGTLHAGSGKNLLYYINGKEAIVGVSSYMLKDGDIIEWKLE